jgi:thiol:disulfide interchange protein
LTQEHQEKINGRDIEQCWRANAAECTITITASHYTASLRKMKKTTEGNFQNFEAGFLHELRELTDYWPMLTFCTPSTIYLYAKQLQQSVTPSSGTSQVEFHLGSGPSGPTCMILQLHIV